MSYYARFDTAHWL